MARRRTRRGRSPTPPSGPKRFLLFALGVSVGALAAGWLAGSHTHIAPMGLHLGSHHAAPPPRRPNAAIQLRRTDASGAHEHSNGVPRPRTREAPLAVPAGHPRVAVIFDDAGYNLRAAREVLVLPRPVTISVLPELPYSTPIAEEAERRGVQVLLHLPVQPDDPALNPGPGRVTVDMNDDAIARTVTSDLATVPGAVGANNHMGSRGTADPRVMHAVLGVMKSRAMFFVDSLTSSRSVAAQTARAMGVPTAVRTVFLDGQDDPDYVRGQFHALIRTAQLRGQAIAIGHVGRVTPRIFRSMLPEFDEAGVQFVPVSMLVH